MKEGRIERGNEGMREGDRVRYREKGRGGKR